MAKPHWALKDILYEVTITGVEIKVFTFQPCHLWLRWTPTYPQEHLVPVISRGVAIHSDKRFCFVNYHDNEQAEGDDTYIHTFLKEPWAYCETRYFYFHGRMGSERSPSTSAIFKYHRIEPELPFETSDQNKLENNYFHLCQYWNAGSQTFTPDHDYTAVKLSIMLSQSSLITRGPYIVKITRVDGLPWEETVLWQESRYSTDLPDPTDKEFVHFDLPNLAFSNGVPYRAIVHTTLGWERFFEGEWIPAEAFASLQWWYQSTGDPYPRGSPYYGVNFRDNIGPWQLLAPDGDFAFIVWQAP